MNQYIKKVKPAFIFACIIFGIILLIYAFMSILNTAGNDNSVSGGISAEQESKLPSEGDKSKTLEEESGGLFAQETDELYAASRGDIDRYNQKDQTESKQTNSSSRETDTSAAEPAAPAQPKTTAPASVESDAPTSAAPAPAAPEPVKAAAQEAPAAAPEAKISASAAPTAAAPEAVPAAPAAESSDLDLLARLITAEAQGEPFEAQVAVGAVVMNRVKSGDWPNSIKSVIYQKIGEYYQFTPVVNGWIDKPAEPEAVEAAKEAMNGSDPTNGAQFYYDDKCTNEWILAKPVSFRVGHMIFAF